MTARKFSVPSFFVYKKFGKISPFALYITYLFQYNEEDDI